MESYVGNTPPNERFSLWDVCFMCFLGAAAERYGVGNPVFKNIFFYGGIHMSYFFAYRDFMR
jgi:hypothetical protein